MKATDWIPAVDIAEDEKAYIIKAELPEVAKEDVKATMERGVLTISGERKLEKEEKGKKFHRIERAYGHFARSFNLPEDGDVANITATQKNGVLTVVVPKAPQSTPRQIDVKVS
ncbi:MAG: Hsp20/alpha crystallin family protein [Verrucomicrobia bacterium]|nr:MAG: Hsp20/alpha crystallin family protein [Verrucomicrobiota bacterium]